uniref:Uncharacterized protein n=1 Tax=Hippocampus comes TaxID=109280 RepID=A0A3Q2Y1H8_HIPCM
MSSTFTTIVIVPDLGGVPPSTAVNVSVITACFSLSKSFLSTNSGVTLSPLCTSREKCSFWLSLYEYIAFLPTSAS